MGRPASLAYLGQVARSAEQLGFDAALTPTGAWCEDAWVSTAMLAGVSDRLKFLVAFRPGLTSPTLAAQMAATFQNMSERPAAAQRRHRRRGRRAAQLRRLPRQGRPLRPLRRVPAPSYAACGPARPSTSTASTFGSRGHGCSSCPSSSRRSTSAAPRRPRGRWPPSTPTSTSPGASPRQPWPRRSSGSASSPRTRAARSRFGIRMHTISRDSSAGRLGRGRPAAGGHRRRDDRARAGGAAPQRLGGPAPDARAQPGQARGAGGLPQRVGRCRPGPRRRGHRAGRQPRGGRRPHRGVPPASASTSSCSPAIPTWRSPTGSARASCRSSPSAACGTTPSLDSHRASVPFGASVAPHERQSAPPCVVGNPKVGSRTLAAATAPLPRARGRARAGRRPRRARRRRPRPSRPRVARLVEQVAVRTTWSSSPCPTYKAALTGLLKAFLDRFPADGLAMSSPYR